MSAWKHQLVWLRDLFVLSDRPYVDAGEYLSKNLGYHVDFVVIDDPVSGVADQTTGDDHGVDNSGS